MFHLNCLNKTLKPIKPKTIKQIPKLICFVILILTGSCTNNNGIKIFIENQGDKNDSLVIRNLITEEPIIILPCNIGDTLIKTDEPIVVSINRLVDNDMNFHLGILTPNSEKSLIIDSGGKVISNSLADSLLHYLFTSNNSFIGENQNLIFDTKNPKDVYFLFDSLITKRDSVINRYENILTSTEKEILDFQNSARAYSFLIYYGRLIRNLSPDNTYWDFLFKIDNNSSYNKSLPHNLLYKYEIEYLRKHDELESISDFIDFIQLHTNNLDLANYLTAVYIKELIASPSYWQRHNKLFDSVTMLKILEKQQNNPYRDIYERIAEFHFASQEGMEAYNFMAKDPENQSIKLSDFTGKTVLIDVWATWCGACIAQKPHFYELASVYKDNENIQFIAISVDSSVEIWQNYLANNKNLSEDVNELIIPNGMRTEFGERYSINFLPKYILINKEGKIIDSNAQKPSKELESKLNKLLSIN